MMYPFLQLEDKTEIVHSDTLEGGRVRVYVEKPIHGGGFENAAGSRINQVNTENLTTL